MKKEEGLLGVAFVAMIVGLLIGIAISFLTFLREDVRLTKRLYPSSINIQYKDGKADTTYTYTISRLF